MWLMLQLDKDERVVDARSEMVTTLIAQIIRFARPNIQIYDARVVDLYQWVCARYLVGVKRAETRQAHLSSALDRISERTTLAFQTLSRPEAIGSRPSKYENLPYISI
jgi:hypothetical protein